MTGTFQARRLAYAAAGLAVTLVFGTVGYHHYLNESWLQAFYRSMVTVTLSPHPGLEECAAEVSANAARAASSPRTYSQTGSRGLAW